MRFTLTIELGNDAMRTPQDVARALEYVAKMIEYRAPETFARATGAKVPDDNGNTVGEWKVTP